MWDESLLNMENGCLKHGWYYCKNLGVEKNRDLGPFMLTLGWWRDGGRGDSGAEGEAVGLPWRGSFCGQPLVFLCLASPYSRSWWEGGAQALVFLA